VGVACFPEATEETVNKIAIALAAFALCISAYAATPAAADPPTNGCATGNRSSDVQRGILYLAVGDLAPLGYRLPEILDNPANGGNGDGFVCGIPLGNQTTPSGNQLYEFFDNQLAA
jgi:hypothetical protein